VPFCDLNHRLAVSEASVGRKEILQLVTVDKEARIRRCSCPSGDRRFSGRGW